MLILNSEIYISLFLLIPGLIFSGKTFLECAGLDKEHISIYIYIYECKTRGHGNTEQKREDANIARSKNSKTILITSVFSSVCKYSYVGCVHTSCYYIISMYIVHAHKRIHK